MKQHTTITILTALVTLAVTVTANPPDPANYIGSKMCGVCHKAEASGNQLGKWQASPHAKAFETLGTPAAKEAAKKLGIDDPQKSGKCLKCHSTAYNFTEVVATEKIKVEEGVSCESCHGPGKKYMAKSTMESREKSIAAGMIYPATKTCTLCHNSESPTFKGFNEKEYSEKIAHPNPKVKK
ncbi:MAG: Perchlorate reductase subunit gamma [Verrucomicrobiae bacterium]|nr:Perchlorate reductase subunit gamma [Verrucomicrobiae bacterium]